MIDKVEKNSERRRKGRRRAKAGLLLLLAVCAALTAYRAGLMERLLGVLDEAPPGGEIVLGAGVRLAVGRLDGGLAGCSSSGLVLIDKRGDRTAELELSVSDPAVSARDGVAVLWDAGGYEAYMAVSGEIFGLKTRGAVLFAAAGGGLAVIITQDGDYKNKVTVYDKAGEPRFEWRCASGYALSAKISPDGKRLAVVTALSEGSALRVFSIDSGLELPAFEAPGEIFYDCAWLSDNRLCALSGDRLLFFDGGLDKIGEYGFGGRRPLAFASGDFAALALG